MRTSATERTVQVRTVGNSGDHGQHAPCGVFLTCGARDDQVGKEQLVQPVLGIAWQEGCVLQKGRFGVLLVEQSVA